MSKSIKTTGDLRSYLASIMVSVGNGTCDPTKAREIVKVAGQINESFYSEVKVQRLKMDLQQSGDSFGEMIIGDEK
ncbi:MAG: hypothetical protein IPK77_11160 [Cellvibrio sp.]|nr:hypothetical protein [Cellvibrio sp.]MBK8187741.1 hypothetical protein [Cellvibrio sp.]